jgi:hypothetical protein
MFFDEDAPQFARFDVSCVVQLEREHDAVWIWLMKGRLNRQLLRNLLEWLESQRVETIKSVRAEGPGYPVASCSRTAVCMYRCRECWPVFSYCTPTSRWPNKKSIGPQADAQQRTPSRTTKDQGNRWGPITFKQRAHARSVGRLL